MAAVVETSIEAVTLHKLIMGTGLGYHAVLDHEYDVRISDGRETMSNNNAGSTHLSFVQGVLNNLLRLGI